MFDNALWLSIEKELVNPDFAERNDVGYCACRARNNARLVSKGGNASGGALSVDILCLSRRSNCILVNDTASKFCRHNTSCGCRACQNNCSRPPDENVLDERMSPIVLCPCRANSRRSRWLLSLLTPGDRGGRCRPFAAELRATLISCRLGCSSRWAWPPCMQLHVSNS